MTPVELGKRQMDYIVSSMTCNLLLLCVVSNICCKGVVNYRAMLLVEILFSYLTV